jgi:hypothetical protein
MLLRSCDYQISGEEFLEPDRPYLCRRGNTKGISHPGENRPVKTTRFGTQPYGENGGDAMDGTELSQIELATTSIFGLKRRLPYSFKCRCERTIRITQPGRFRFVCLCGLNHNLRDSEFD